ncbi:MAG: T9SS type A sorting domain-containing protein, partial [Bacteroidota bacterium]
PNPANTVFTLRLIRMQNISLDIKVYSSVGALMYEAESASLTENGEYRISCEKWPAGMYVLHLSFNGSMRSTQLIIQ